MSEQGITVLSLFDGMSCGQLALERVGIKVKKYYASELDKYAMIVTQENFFDTAQLGDVTKWQDWEINWAEIDLLIGGSPCQGFSFAGKGLAFDDPRSKLFFTYIDILDHVEKANPDIYFLMENVRMKKEHLAVITEYLGVDPVQINSALVSAQNRVRYYWTNWEFGQPEDRGVVLRDILEDGGSNTVNMSNKFIARQKDRKCLVSDLKDKAVSLSAMEYVKNGRQGDYILCDGEGKQLLTALQKTSTRIKGISVSKDGIRPHQGDLRKSGISEMGRLLFETAEKSYAVTTSHAPKVLQGDFIDLENSEYTDRCKAQIKKNSKHPNQKGVAVCGNSNMTGSGVNIITEDNLLYRKLTPVECERLQTVPDNYTDRVSNTQRYKMLGNGWTRDVIVHIFKELPFYKHTEIKMRRKNRQIKMTVNIPEVYEDDEAFMEDLMDVMDTAEWKMKAGDNSVSINSMVLGDVEIGPEEE